MQLLFVYGSLKHGFPNQHVNTGRRVAGRFRTLERYPLYLLGAGEVPCLVAPAGSGYQVAGELYEVGAADLARMDKLERIGEPDGYERVEILVEHLDAASPEQVRALVYLKQESRIPSATVRIGPFEEYTLVHAARFHWQGAA